MHKEKSQQTKPGGGLSLSPEASKHLHGEIDAAREAGMDLGDWRIKQRMEKLGLDWTRENFIKAKWYGELPTDEDGEPFVPEDEIPEELRE